MTPMKAIRIKCYECSGYTFKEVTLCPCSACALWIYRFGCSPTTTCYKKRMALAKKKYPEEYKEVEKEVNGRLRSAHSSS